MEPTPVDPFEDELKASRAAYVESVNAATLSVFEEFLAGFICPIETLKSNLLTANQSIQATQVSASFPVDFTPILQANPSLELFISSLPEARSAHKVSFISGMIQASEIEALFFRSNAVKGVERIRNELKGAFPAAMITIDLATECSKTVKLIFTVSYAAGRIKPVFFM